MFVHQTTQQSHKSQTILFKTTYSYTVINQYPTTINQYLFKMCKRRNESSQVKKEDYEKQSGENVSVHSEFLHMRASKDQLQRRHIIRANRGRNRNQVENYSAQDHS